MWKFKTSKFKNAAPKIPKKEEWVTDVQASNLLHSCGSHVAASAVYVVFNTDAGGNGSLGVLPLTTRGRQLPGSIPHIRAHADFVTDFGFSPFDDFTLATTSHDGLVKIWQLPDVESVSSVTSEPVTTLSVAESHVELLSWHPTAQGVIASTAGKRLTLHDISTQQTITDFEPHGDLVQSASWRGDGSVLVTSCKDKKLRIIDPRANNVDVEVNGHGNMRDSRVLWLGNKDLILSSGFDMMRSREVSLRDSRNLGSTICTKSFDTSAGVLMPFYDEDTGMLFVAGKGDTLLRYMEVTSQDIPEYSSDTVEQIKGLGLVSKRAMDVMTGEVDRLMLLGQHALVPLPYHVPRKSYQEFHEDLFPETLAGVPALTSQEWRDGSTQLVSTVSLNPAKNSRSSLVRHGDREPTPASLNQDHVTDASPTTVKTEPAKPAAAKPVSSNARSSPDSSSQSSQILDVPKLKHVPMPVEDKAQSTESSPEPAPAKPSALVRDKKSTFSAVRQSKFRHLQGKTLHKSEHIDNLRNLSKSVPGESDLFYSNSEFCAFPLGGSGGLVGVLKLDNTGRLPDTGIPGLQNGSMVMDSAWDPFDNYTLAVACDDAMIRIWKIPGGGLSDTLTAPLSCLHGHTEKIYFVKYHPLASGVLASGSYDMSLKIWDTATGEVRIQLQGHTDTIFCFAWSPDGKLCATMCKDGLLRVYDPRKSTQPIKECRGPDGTRGARVVWACNGSLLLVTGFSKGSERQVLVYSVHHLGTPIHVQDLDTAPGILIPHYDEDSSTLFLTGRGERTVRAFEVVEEKPCLFALSDYRADGLHQALAFLPKTSCDVTKVQFAKCLRLTPNSVEPVAFSVPRVKMEYFQDDLYPETRVTWEAALSGSEWFSGANKTQRNISLKPDNMKLLSDAPVEAPKPKKYESYNAEHFKTDDEKKEELLGAMMGKFEVNTTKLPQDQAEGVDEDEWDDY